MADSSQKLGGIIFFVVSALSISMSGCKSTSSESTTESAGVVSVASTLRPDRSASLALFQAIQNAGVKPFSVGTVATQFNLTSISCDVAVVPQGSAYTCSTINARDKANPVLSSGVAAKELMTLLTSIGVPSSGRIEGSSVITGQVTCSKSLVDDTSDDNCQIVVTGKAAVSPSKTKSISPSRDDSLALFRTIQNAGVVPFHAGTVSTQFTLTSISCDVSSLPQGDAYTCTIINARDATHPVASNGDPAKELLTKLLSLGVPSNGRIEGSSVITNQVRCSKSLVNDPGDDNCRIVFTVEN